MSSTDLNTLKQRLRANIDQHGLKLATGVLMYMDIQMPWLLRPTWMWEGRAMQEQLPRCKRTAISQKISL